MNAHERSTSPLELDDRSLAVLVACQQRGVLQTKELERLLDVGELAPTCDLLQAAGLLQRAATGLAVSHAGKLALDQLCESLQGELTPDDPAYERRFRREKPTLPFEANTTWAEAICANFRIDPAALRPLVPEMFELDLCGGYAWISLTASRLKDFGMGTIPRALRMNFYQATYRAHVTFTDYRGRTLRGCYFVRSETNSHVMSLTANLLPEFKAHHCSTYPIVMAQHGDHLILTVDSAADPAGKVVLVLDAAHPLAGMPQGSAFEKLSDAQAFIVDFYDAFSYDPDTRDVFLLRIDRGPWNLAVLPAVDSYFGYLAEGPLPAGTAQLDSVFYFRNTPYRWLPLVVERVKQKR
jgi:uncharacterized protein YqjF (DUF2071 family)